MMQPILYLVPVRPAPRGRDASAPGPARSAFNWFVPGLLIQIAIFGTAFVGFGLIAELRSGVVERMRVTPMSRAAMLLGRSLRDVVDPDVPGDPADRPRDPVRPRRSIPPGIAVVLGLLALIGLAVAPLSYARR